MKFVIQRVSHASVTVEGETVGEIQQGFLVLIGVGEEDTEAIADKFVRKMLGLRIFSDAEGKTNLSLKDVGGQLLLISQFTLYADCKKGNRPSFIRAGDPGKAEGLYEYIVDKCRAEIPVVEKGCFGAHMKVQLENDGPFTIILDETIL
ncbi:MAG: D-tyrosyl-tRNA(Tyr) deacylase [Lachnospiraceae bacterium]|jgi:D-tyrosyl-tRNA(Tyr) deacylase|nr:D-tyrosyl-tRNA(Tyr) deacylase [Lachnospiraceae bacterium]